MDSIKTMVCVRTLRRIYAVSQAPKETVPCDSRCIEAGLRIHVQLDTLPQQAVAAGLIERQPCNPDPQAAESPRRCSSRGGSRAGLLARHSVRAAIRDSGSLALALVLEV